MVRTAASLKTFEELDLSDAHKIYLCKMGNEKGFTLEEWVIAGRRIAFDVADGLTDHLTMRDLELFSALDKAGFIRHDLYPRTYCLLGFYGFLTGEHLWDYLCDNSEYYETLPVVTDEQVESVIESLDNRLGTREAEVIKLRWGIGIDNPKPCTPEQVAQAIGITHERVRQIEAKAFRRLKYKNDLPAIFDVPDKEEKVDAIIKELDELYENPVVKRVAELRQRLNTMSKEPFVYAEKASKYVSYISGPYDDPTAIDSLGLSGRTQCALRRANVYTVADVMRCAENGWTNVKNLGTKGVKEVEARIRALGYDNLKFS